LLLQGGTWLLVSPLTPMGYASNVGAGHVSAAIGVFTAAYASRLVEHADGLARAAGRYAESDSDGGQKIAGSGL
jgi:hypothetical protein